MTDVDPAKLVPAVLADGEFAAETKAEVLRAEGIDAFVFAAERSWTGGLGLPGINQQVPVLVKREDVERARKILEQRIEDSVDLDWDEVDVGEREDKLPLHEVGRMPLPARVGLAVAAAIIVLSAIVAFLVAIT